MKLIATALVLALASCGPKPVPPPGGASVWVHASVRNAAGVGLASARVDCAPASGETNVNGDVSFQVPASSSCDFTAAALGYVTYREALSLGADDVTKVVALDADMPPRPTLEQVREYRGLLTGVKDGAGRKVWGPALPGASPEVRADWLLRMSAAGVTHLTIGPFDGGPAYPGVDWPNPDWSRDAASIRSLVLDILATPTTRGHGMVPVIFLDGGGSNPGPRTAVVWPTVDAALQDIEQYTITLPCGWESQDWLPRECYDAAWSWRERVPMDAVIAWHGWPERSNGASNNPHPGNTDPWLGPPDANGNRYGSWSLFWDPARSPFSMFLYQSRALRDMGDVNCGGVRPGATGSDALRNVWLVDKETGRSGWTFSESCWMNRTSDAIARVGAGVCSDAFGFGGPCGPGRKTFVIFETHAYYEWRETPGQPWDPRVSTAIADFAQSECEKYGVRCGFGNSFPTAE